MRLRRIRLTPVPGPVTGVLLFRQKYPKPFPRSPGRCATPLAPCCAAGSHSRGVLPRSCELAIRGFTPPGQTLLASALRHAPTGLIQERLLLLREATVSGAALIGAFPCVFSTLPPHRPENPLWIPLRSKFSDAGWTSRS